MNTQHLKRAAELLIFALNNVDMAEQNLANIEGMEYYTIFNRKEEKKEDIARAKDLIKTANESLQRQIKYTLVEMGELK